MRNFKLAAMAAFGFGALCAVNAHAQETPAKPPQPSTQPSPTLPPTHPTSPVPEARASDAAGQPAQGSKTQRSGADTQRSANDAATEACKHEKSVQAKGDCMKREQVKPAKP